MPSVRADGGETIANRAWLDDAGTLWLGYCKVCLSDDDHLDLKQAASVSKTEINNVHKLCFVNSAIAPKES